MRAALVLLAAILAGICTLPGCAGEFVGDADAGASSSSGGSGGTSGGTSASSGAPADVSCKGFKADTAEITPSDEDGTPAESQGGTVVDGTYELDRVRLYNANFTVGFGGFKEKIQITGTHYVRAYSIDANLTTTSGAFAGTFAAKDKAITQVVTCDDGASDSASGPFEGTYTATPTDLTLVQPSVYSDDWTAELHFTRKP